MSYTRRSYEQNECNLIKVECHNHNCKSAYQNTYGNDALFVWSLISAGWLLIDRYVLCPRCADNGKSLVNKNIIKT